MWSSMQSTFDGAQWGPDSQYLPINADTLLSTTIVDLSGYTMQDLTFATLETTYQDPGIYSTTDAAVAGPGSSTSLELVEMISQVPMTDAELLTMSTRLGQTVPGQLDSSQDFTQIIYGSYRLYVPNNNLGLAGFMQLIQSGGFGSKEPTASQKLYCYRMVKCLTPALNDILNIPACRVGLAGMLYEEDQVPYLMRLKRSYEYQQP